MAKKTNTPGRKEKKERNKAIKRAVASGKSIREVGEKYDISGKRVHDIVKRK